MKHIDLFAGIGGFSLGFENAGIETVAHVEIDKSCQKVLSSHWPNHMVFADVREVGENNLPHADIITFGSPCQDLSIAGKRAGLEGGRSGLFFEAVRIIREIKPKYAVWENVPGALSSNSGRDFQSVLSTLVDRDVPMPRSGRWATAGMVRVGETEAAWRILDAQYFGVAQRRRRIFLVFCSGEGSASSILFEREGMQWNPPARRTPGKETTGAFGENPAESGRRVNSVEVACIKGAAIGRKPSARPQYGEVLTNGSTYTLNCTEVHAVAGTVSCKWSKGSGGPAGDEARNLVTDMIDVAAPLVSRQAKGPFTDPVNDNVITVLNDQGGERMAISEDVSETLRSENHRHSPKVAGNPFIGVRRLTPTECSRLQGFPDDWLEIYDADETQAHAREILHGMWKEIRSNHREGRRFRIALSLLTPEILLAGVYGGWISWEMACRGAESGREIQGEDAWPEDFMRELRIAAEHRPSPYRRESFEQFARKLNRPLQELPLEGAQARAYLLDSRMWPQASQEWVLRYARPHEKTRQTLTLSDSTRYRQLGNAVAVPVVEWIAKRIMMVETESEG